MAAMEALEDKVKALLIEYDPAEVEAVLADVVKTKQSNSRSTSGSFGHKSSHTEVFEQIDDSFNAEAIKLFNIADKDNSGTIDEYELHELLKVLLGPISLPESNRIYQDMDANRSGSITYDEFLAALVKYKWNTSQIDTTKRASTVQEFEWEIPYSELELKKKIGSGSYGVVHNAAWRGISVAVKTLRKSTSKSVMNDFKHEVSILGKLRHPNVVLFMGACTKENMCIVTEYLEGGSVGDYLKKETLTLTGLVQWAKQTAFGLNYLHLSNIVHRDVKPDNLLLDANHNVKLCDFGLSTVKPQEGVLTKNLGSPVWRAPEMLLGKEYNESADIYSYAITVWGLFGLEVLDDPNLVDVSEYQELVDAVAVKGKRPNIPKRCPAELKDLLRACWDSDPTRRLNCAQIIARLESVSDSLIIKKKKSFFRKQSGSKD